MLPPRTIVSSWSKWRIKNQTRSSRPEHLISSCQRYHFWRHRHQLCRMVEWRVKCKRTGGKGCHSVSTACTALVSTSQQAQKFMLTSPNLLWYESTNTHSLYIFISLSSVFILSFVLRFIVCTSCSTMALPYCSHTAKKLLVCWSTFVVASYLLQSQGNEFKQTHEWCCQKREK